MPAIRPPRTPARPFPYVMRGLAVELADTVGIDDWARMARIPHRKKPGESLDGATVRKLLGVEGKSWDPRRFGDLRVVADTARRALEDAGLAADDLDTVIAVTCTPYQVNFDQDLFWLMRELRVPDDVVPLQLGSGCSGLARAAAVLARQTARRALVVLYDLASAAMSDGDGVLRPEYRENTHHPYGAAMWASAALFSDAVAAVVFAREPDADGLALYSRDSRAFGDDPGLDDPMMHYLGGGVSCPPGRPDAPELSCYGMNSPLIGPYYHQGMLLNHADLCAHRPDYLERVRRLYTHQANPRSVAELAAALGLPAGQAPSNVAEIGNTVSPSTLALLAADREAGAVGAGDPVCFSVVGAGPERGALLVALDLPAG